MKSDRPSRLPPKVAQKPTRGELYTREEIENAIKRNFSTDTGRIAIRHLWSLDPVHRFRVNWWNEEGIIRSRYLKVVADEEGIEITEV